MRIKTIWQQNKRDIKLMAIQFFYSANAFIPLMIMNLYGIPLQIPYHTLLYGFVPLCIVGLIWQARVQEESCQ